VRAAAIYACFKEIIAGFKASINFTNIGMSGGDFDDDWGDFVESPSRAAGIHQQADSPQADQFSNPQSNSADASIPYLSTVNQSSDGDGSNGKLVQQHRIEASSADPFEAAVPTPAVAAPAAVPVPDPADSEWGDFDSPSVPLSASAAPVSVEPEAVPRAVSPVRLSPVEAPAVASVADPFEAAVPTPAVAAPAAVPVPDPADSEWGDFDSPSVPLSASAAPVSVEPEAAPRAVSPAEVPQVSISDVSFVADEEDWGDFDSPVISAVTQDVSKTSLPVNSEWAAFGSSPAAFLEPSPSESAAFSADFSTAAPDAFADFSSAAVAADGSGSSGKDLFSSTADDDWGDFNDATSTVAAVSAPNAEANTTDAKKEEAKRRLNDYSFLLGSSRFSTLNLI
jgi:hypothetical protein